MEFKTLLVFISLHALVAHALHNKFIIDQPKTDKSVVLGEILTNFLIKYFSDDQIFVSIIFTAAQELELEQKYFLNDLFQNLFDDPILTQFDHNAVEKLDHSIRGKRNSFNLILINVRESLE